MPKLEPKQVQRELDEGKLWPVYWIYGSERMKSRELLKRIRKAIGFAGFGEESIDAAESSSDAIVDAAQSLQLGGGTRLIVIREANLLKDTEALEALFGQPGPKGELTSVCAFLSKDLDGRKKFSKKLVEKAAVVPCEEVAEEEREAWIGYLAKRRGLPLGPEQTTRLRCLDPWNLDIVDQELEKLSIASQESDATDVLLSAGTGQGGADAFLEAFFRRELKAALELLESFADKTEESLPLLGLLAWNVRQLACVVSDREKGTRSAKLGSFLSERFSRWSRAWKLEEVVRLQSALAELDFELKQTPRLPIGCWTALVTSFCRQG